MKHFIGGWAVGFIIAICGIPKDPKDTTEAYVIGFIAHMFIACIFGLAAWGLLP